jgi:hypothetical protein
MAHIEANGQVKTYSQLVDDEALLPALEMDAWVTMARLAIGPGIHWRPLTGRWNRLLLGNEASILVDVTRKRMRSRADPLHAVRA